MIAELTKAEEEMCNMHKKGICDGFSRKCLLCRIAKPCCRGYHLDRALQCSLSLMLRGQKEINEKLEATKRKSLPQVSIPKATRKPCYGSAQDSGVNVPSRPCQAVTFETDPFSCVIKTPSVAGATPPRLLGALLSRGQRQRQSRKLEHARPLLRLRRPPSVSESRFLLILWPQQAAPLCSH